MPEFLINFLSEIEDIYQYLSDYLVQGGEIPWPSDSDDFIATYNMNVSDPNNPWFI